MAAANKQKGDALERATERIQNVLLKHHPEFKTANYIVERNKRVTVAGTQHEIDVLVTTAKDSPYQAQVLFECKNQGDPVDKNVPIVLKEKVEALAATSGFLVCRALTSGARAFIDNHPRLKWVQCDDDFLSPLNSLELTYISHDFLATRVYLKRLGALPSDKPVEWDWKTAHSANCLENFRPINFSTYLKRQLDEFVEKDKKDWRKLYSYEGVHWRELLWEIYYETGEFKLNGVDIEWMQLELRFFAQIAHRRIRSRFELKGHGRHWEFEPIKDAFTGDIIVIDAVQMLSAKKP